MHHVAIMNKSWGLISKILSGEKTIESRWYKTKRTPWDRINKGDIVFFKNSGESVTIKAKVTKVLQYTDLNQSTTSEIYKKYGKRIGLTDGEIKKSQILKNDKRYCILVFLSEPREVKPFNIDKTGFGIGAAWMCTPNIKRIIR